MVINWRESDFFISIKPHRYLSLYFVHREPVAAGRSSAFVSNVEDYGIPWVNDYSIF